MGKFSIYLRQAGSVFFEYDTPKIVHIKSKKVGVINRIIQLGIIIYVIGFVIVYKKGYQVFDNVEASVTSKVKGIAYTNYTGIPGMEDRIWDVADYVIPPQLTNAFYVMTNGIITPNQTQGTCPEDLSLSMCTDSSNCTQGVSVPNGNGIMTGKCVPSDVDPKKSTCEIRSWCPVERDRLMTNTSAFPEAENFTVLIKNSIAFKKFNFQKRNILNTVSDKNYLTHCHWEEDKDPYCPVFKLGDIIRKAGVGHFDSIAYLGGVIALEITWNCNLDHDWTECRPKYSFRRLDVEDSPIAKGWNFRTAYHFQYNGQDTRTLMKSYGILFKVVVRGTAGKFNMVPVLLNFGSGLALLAISTVLCDLVVLYVLKQKDLFRKKKYLDVKGDDAYKIFKDEVEGSIKDERSGSYDSITHR